MISEEPSPTPRYPYLGRWLALLELGLGLFFAITFCGFAFWDRFRVPYFDDWSILDPLVTSGPSISGLFKLHNGSMILTLRLLFTADYITSGAPGFITFGVALASHLTGVLVWYLVISRSRITRFATRGLLIGTMLTLSFFSYQLQPFVMASAADHAMTMPALLLATGCALVAIDRFEHGGSPRRWLMLAVIPALAAPLTTVQGVAVPFVVAVILYVALMPVRYQIPFLAIGLVAALGFGIAVGPGVTSQIPHLSTGALIYFLAFFGSFVSAVSTTLGIVIGLLALGAGIALIVQLIVQRRASAQVERLALAVLLFVGSTALLITIGRTDLGAVQAAQSRYTLYSLQYWLALIALFLLRLERAPANRARTLVSGVIVLSTLALFPVHIFLGTVWYQKAATLQPAALALRVGVRDDEWVRSLYQAPSLVYQVSSMMEREGRAEFLRFDERGRSWTGQSTTTVCEGEFRLESSPSTQSEGRGFRISGRLVTNTAGKIMIVDGSGVVQGLAFRAPLVAVPDPRDADVVEAARQDLTSTEHSSTEDWLGFTRSGSGPPYNAYLVDDTGRSVCVTSFAP